MSYHKEEGHSRIIKEEKDREKHETFYQTVYTLLILKITQQKLRAYILINYQTISEC